MKRALCGKMSVGYQNVEIAKSPSNVTYKVGPKGQQCGGTDGSNYKLVNHKDLASWNMVALSMYLRSPSSDSNCSMPPLSALNASLRPEGDKLLPCSTSNLYSGHGSLSGADHETRNVLSSEDRRGLHERADTGVSTSWSTESCSTDSSDDGKPRASNFRRQFGSDSFEDTRLIENYRGRSGSSRLPHHDNDGLELSSSSSSIGGFEDSSCSSGEGSNGESSGDMEVQSAPRGPLHHMGILEASLPIKRGLSKFFGGKARSFASLIDVSSIEELPKPDNPYARRRRIANVGDRHKSFPPLSRSSTAGISKRPISASGSRGGLAMAVAMGSKLEEASRSFLSSSLSSSSSLSFTDLVEAGSHSLT